MSSICVSLSACVYTAFFNICAALHENQYDEPRGPQNARMTQFFFLQLMLTCASDVARRESTAKHIVSMKKTNCMQGVCHGKRFVLRYYIIARD